ncbi:MAG TPA: efflux RND transporter permease subunit, partial [Thermoanaerobaculia bacterium]
MQKLAEVSVKRPVFATVLILSLVVVGAFSYFKLGVDRFPKVEFPFVAITTVLPGAAPEEVETELTDKIEEAVNTISGIDELMSMSSENVSLVWVSFELEKDADVAAQEVRDRVNGILGELPRDAEPPIIQKLDPDSEPVIAVALWGPASERDITEYADKTLRRRLETVSGVGQVTIVGGRPRQLNVVTDTAQLSGVGLTAADVVNSLQAQNVQIPGGKVEQGLRDLTLRTYGRVQEPKSFADLPVAMRNGHVIRVGDVARVEDSVGDVESIARVDGKPAVVLFLRKQSGENSIAVVEGIKERLAELEKDLPKGWEMRIVRDQSTFIIAAVDAVKEHLILGAIFAALVVWVFLSAPRVRQILGMLFATGAIYLLLFGHGIFERIPTAISVVAATIIGVGMLVWFARRSRPTIIAAVAIPSSLIATFALMAVMGFTLNMITLLALTLAVGIVIDDAVVILENIFRHMEEKNLTPMQAAVSGTKEVGLAVMATSLSLIAVFLPVAFMGGIVGRFMYSFGVTMAFAIAVSLLVSFTLTPMMASRWLKRDDLAEDEGSRERGFYPPIERAYMRLLEWSMRHRWVIVAAMVAVFIATIPLFILVDKNFLPNDDESQFQISVRAPEGASVQTTLTILDSIAARVRQFNGIASTVVTIGDDPQKTQNLGSVYVNLVEIGERNEDQFALMDRVRKEILPQYEPLGLRAQVVPINAFGGGAESEIQFWVGGPDLKQLDEYAQELMAAIRPMAGVTDVDSNFIVGKPELGVYVDRAKAADLGVRVQDLAATLNVLVGGQKATSYFEGGEEYEVHVRAEKEARSNAAAISTIDVPSTTLGTVRLAEVVDLRPGTGPSLINRLNRRRMVMVGANMLPGYSSQAVMDKLEETAKKLNMPSEYSYGLTGRSREQEKAATNFMLAFILSGIFMYLILAAQFESWIHPVTIMLALPMTVPFALLSILLLNQSLNIFSSLGILVLFG